jgi:hypothetical protein
MLIVGASPVGLAALLTQEGKIIAYSSLIGSIHLSGLVLYFKIALL